MSLPERPPCPEPLRGCKYKPPYSDNHHIHWPEADYTSPLEKKFYRSEVNVVKGICRCIHDLEHLKRPPVKPTPDMMREMLR